MVICWPGMMMIVDVGSQGDLCGVGVLLVVVVVVVVHAGVSVVCVFVCVFRGLGIDVVPFVAGFVLVVWVHHGVCFRQDQHGICGCGFAGLKMN